MPKFIRNNYLIILILVIGFFLRAYHPLKFFQYSHDQDLTGWFIRDVIVNHHLRLIGQETSSHGIFIGPYFYYLQIPFYLLTRLDPAGALLLPIILGIFAIFSVYFVFAKLFSKQVGLIGSIIYSFSSLIIFTDREVVPTQPVMLWTIWFLYAIWQILKGKKYGYLIIGILVGLIWSINLQLVILLPLILLTQLFSKKKINLKKLVYAISISIALNIPFIAFEIRHGFQQTKALFTSLTSNKDYITGTATGFLPKLDRTMQLVYKNTTNLFGVNTINLDAKIFFWLLLALFLFLVWKKKISKQLGLILFLWEMTYILFFTKIFLNISEYYLNGMNILFILIASLTVNLLIQNKILKFCLIGGFIFINLITFFTRSDNGNGYLDRKAVISYIKKDAEENHFPCVSLSFIVSPGNDFGYRYFTWRAGLRTKEISNNVPVYSIVFPLSKVDAFDKRFGAIGVVKPDYKRYNLKTVQKACEGEDYTVSQPMFGFTK